MNAREQEPRPSRSAIPRPASVAWVEAIAATAPIENDRQRLLAHVLEERAASHGAAPALLSDRECLSFSELMRRANGYEGWARAQGLRKGDCVALLMSNRPEYVAIWLGLTRAGIITALINTALTGRSLAHCLEVARPVAVIAEPGLLDAVIVSAPDWSRQTVRPELWSQGAAHLMAPGIRISDVSRRPGEWDDGPPVTIDDTALLIYTSGTTGLPKAARVSHRRILSWALWFKGMLGNTEADRMYDCLPLFHSVGGVVAVAATLVAGGSTVIAERFSARQFWDDVRRWKCTQFQYIGELCRYLLSLPPAPEENRHGLRVACGNGLRGDIWQAFQQRFAIPQILEFYAATEGNFSLFNAEGRPGAIGRIPPYLRHRFPTAIVRFDFEQDRPMRGPDGFCIRADVGEAGEAIGRIGDGRDGSGRFDGYTDTSASDAKILRDVFEKGDAWFRTGDLMRIDTQGYYTFVDRIGDTFRWKGENVATLEVANILATAPRVRDAVVYGVTVPGADGKAGMAYLQVEEDFDPEMLRRHAAMSLPAHAIPRFLRIGTEVAVTETFKHRKAHLARDGFDPRRTCDPILVLLDDGGGYRRLDPVLHDRICRGAERL